MGGTDETRARMKKASEAICANFDRGAGGYDEFEGRSAFFASLLEELLALASVPTGSRVLDVGCGTGASTEKLLEIAADGGEVTGIDLSEGMLEVARRRAGGRARFLAMDGCDYSRELDGSFDAVVYNAVLFMLPDAAASLDCALEVLAPGGILLVSNLDAITVEGVPVPELLFREGYKSGRHSLSPWEKVVPLVEERFIGVHTRALDYALTCREFVAFYGLEPMSAGLMPGLPYPERKAIIEEFGQRLRRGGKVARQRWQLLAALKGEERG